MPSSTLPDGSRAVVRCPYTNAGRATQRGVFVGQVPPDHSWDPDYVPFTGFDFTVKTLTERRQRT